MPELNELYDKYSKKGLVLIGIHSDPGTAKGVDAAKAQKMKYPVAFDGGTFMKQVGCDSYPDYVLVDRKGVARVVDLANEETERAVKRLLEEK